jgi:hypothetical protein
VSTALSAFAPISLKQPPNASMVWYFVVVSIAIVPVPVAPLVIGAFVSLAHRLLLVETRYFALDTACAGVAAADKHINDRNAAMNFRLDVTVGKVTIGIPLF